MKSIIFYVPVQSIHVDGADAIKHNQWIQDRGLDGNCEVNGKHGWLYLPKEEEQKQYIVCIHCLERGHI